MARVPTDLGESGGDSRFMKRALDLALEGRGRVEPNPVVGAVVVAAGEIVGEGWHAQFGGPHAEVRALEQAGDRARGASLFVTLEPCCHQGKTPPCTDRILAAGIERVVYAARDPHSLTAGRGPARLRAAGVEVVKGIEEEEARRQNRRYERHLLSVSPFMIAKWAMSLDGKIADAAGGSRYITGPDARRLVHEIRGACDAIVVGRGTAEKDDPDLTARDVPRLRPGIRVVLDSGLRLALSSRLVRTAGEHPVWIATGAEADPEREADLVARGCRVLRFGEAGGRLDIKAVFTRLKAEGIERVLLEGGGELLASAFAAGLVHQVMAFVARIILGGRTAPTPVGGDGYRSIADPARLEDVRTTALGNDFLVEGFLPG